MHTAQYCYFTAAVLYCLSMTYWTYSGLTGLIGTAVESNFTVSVCMQPDPQTFTSTHVMTMLMIISMLVVMELMTTDMLAVIMLMITAMYALMLLMKVMTCPSAFSR